MIKVTSEFTINLDIRAHSLKVKKKKSLRKTFYLYLCSFYSEYFLYPASELHIPDSVINCGYQLSLKSHRQLKLTFKHPRCSILCPGFSEMFSDVFHIKTKAIKERKKKFKSSHDLSQKLSGIYIFLIARACNFE